MDDTAKLEEEVAPLLDPSSDRKQVYCSINGDVNESDSLITNEDELNDTHTLSRTHQGVNQNNDTEIPSVLFNDHSLLDECSQQKQGSFITIFAIWNTMLGTSILTMPWAIQEAGIVCGIIMMIVMAGLCLYTAYRIIQVQSLLGIVSLNADYADVCRFLLGPWAEWMSSFFSISSLLGAVIVYWVLMSNFLYNSVVFIYDLVEGKYSANDSGPTDDVVCLIQQNSSSKMDNDQFSSQWNLSLTPLYLIIFVAPLINFKSPTFFTKFNALGVVSALFIMCFTVVKAAKWGINAQFTDGQLDNYIPMFQWSFPNLSGTLSLSYFIHNCVTAIMRNQKRPENNARDLTIAYCLVAITYMWVGLAFYISFPLPKICMADNLLNNLTNSDNLSFAARLFLLFQMLTVFPLLVFILRVQFYTQVLNLREPTLKYILPLNAVLIGIAVLFAIYYPHIGQMVRYTGAFCGLAYSFALPCLTFMAALRLRGRLTTKIIVIHVVIISIGVANFIAQFLMSNS